MYLGTLGSKVGRSLQSYIVGDGLLGRVLELDALGHHGPEVGSKLDLRLRDHLRQGLYQHTHHKKK